MWHVWHFHYCHGKLVYTCVGVCGGGEIWGWGCEHLVSPKSWNMYAHTYAHTHTQTTYEHEHERCLHNSLLLEKIVFLRATCAVGSNIYCACKWLGCSGDVDNHCLCHWQQRFSCYIITSNHFAFSPLCLFKSLRRAGTTYGIWRPLCLCTISNIIMYGNAF